MVIYDRAMSYRKQQGFTLVEMSMVMVVIGLVAAGILVGRDLIRHAELVKLHSQYTGIVSAIQTFKTKYNCLPGDCANATDFFGTYNACGALLFAKDSLDAGTCNGDGDGRIDAQATLYEMLTLWQQLASAGLISGAYTGGVSLQGGSIVLPGVNCPVALPPATRC